MLAGLEYLEAKTGLASVAAQKLDHYNAEYLQIDSLHNQIIRGTKTKAMALGMLDYLIEVDGYIAPDQRSSRSIE